MSLSDGVASLEVGIQKLAVAIEGLALNMAAQGEVDLRKLPWYTPHYVAGDSIRYVSCLPTVHLDNNKVTKAPTGANFKVSDSTFGEQKVFDKMPLPDFIREMADSTEAQKDEANSGAHQVFNETTTPNLCLDHFQLVGNSFVDTQTPMPAANSNFSNLSKPITNPSIFSGAMIDNAQRRETGVLSPDVQTLGKNLGLVDASSRPNLIFETELSNVHKTLDKMTVPDFIREIAQVATTEKACCIECDHVPASEIVSDNLDDTLSHEQRVFAKLSALDDLHFHDMVIRRSTSSRMLSQSIHMSTIPFLSHGEPVILFPGLENGWISHLSYKEIHSWGNLKVRQDRRVRLENTIWLPSFLYDVACSLFNSDLRLDKVIIVKHETRDDFDHVRLHIEGLCPSRLGLVCCPYPIVLEHSYYQIYSATFKKGLDKFFNPGIGVIKLMLFYALTLEDKDGFKGVRDDGLVALGRTMSTMKYARNHQTLYCILLMNAQMMMIVSPFVFDPGGLTYDSTLVEQVDGVLVLLLFDHGRNDDLLWVIMRDYFYLAYEGRKSGFWVFDPGGYGSRWMINRSQAHHYNDKRPKDSRLEGYRIICSLEFSTAKCVQQELQLFGMGFLRKIKHILVDVDSFDSFETKALALEHTGLSSALWQAYVNTVLLYRVSNLELIFGLCPLKVEDEALVFLRNTIASNSENEAPIVATIIFIFDPGGLHLPICKSCTFPAKTVTLHPIRNSCCSHTTRILTSFREATVILEDKDHFKGSVMIHTKIIKRVF